MSRSDDNAEPTPVFSRQVTNDTMVTDWEFYGFFKSPSALSEFIEEKIEPAGFGDDPYTWQSNEGKWQFKFVFNWTAEMLKQKHPPYTI